MVDIQCVKTSRAVYSAHVTRTIQKADNILREDALTDSQVAKLTSILEQLTVKRGMLKQVNGQVLEAVEPSGDLEAEILETKETQDDIHEYMAVIKSRVDTRCTTTKVTTLDATAPAFVPTRPPPSTAAREPVSQLPKLTLPVISGDPLCGNLSVTHSILLFTTALLSVKSKSSVI